MGEEGTERETRDEGGAREPDTGPAPAATRAAASADWPMFGRDRTRTGAAPDPSKGITQPSMKWDKGESVDSWGTTIGDFTGNVEPLGGSQLPQTDSAVYAEDGYVYIVNGEKGRLQWVLNASLLDDNEDVDPVYTTPTLTDPDTDGRLDIIFATSSGDQDSQLFMFEPEMRYQDGLFDWTFAPDGNATKLKWHYDLTGTVPASQPLLADIDSDGKDEVVLATISDTGSPLLYALEIGGTDVNPPAGGRLIWDQPKELEGSRVSSAAFFTYSSIPRLAITTFDPTEGVRLYLINALTNDTLKVETLPNNVLQPVTTALIPSPVVAELDSASSGQEIVVLVPYESGVDGAVHVFSSTGIELWSSTAADVVGGFDGGTPAVADIDGDGQRDIVINGWMRSPPVSAGSSIMCHCPRQPCCSRTTAHRE